MNGHRWPLTTRWMFDLTFAGDLLLGTTVSRTSNDRTLLAWDLTAHAPKWEVPIPAQASLRVSHDGTWVATWDQEALRCWDLSTGQLLRQCQQRMFVVAALPGDVLLCLGNGSLFALSVRTGQVEKLCFLGETHEVAVNAAGTRLACVLSRKTLAIFDLHARAKVAEAPAPPRDRVVFRPGDAELVLPDAPGGPAIADAQTGVTVAVLKGAPTQG